MLQIRITVLRDKPASDILKDHAVNGYYLFHDTETNLYFLCDGYIGRFAPSPFWGGYDPALNLSCEFDTSYLDRFKDEHSKELEYYTDIDPLIVKDAIALSEKFSTRVLCAYANDEADDFAVTAENGELVSLRFKAGRRQGKRIDDEIARDIDTDIHAVRIHPDTDNQDDDGVFEYTAYEAIQTQDKPLSLHPYFKYMEGEIQRQVIFKEISSEPESVTPTLLFRNAFLEFEAAFGQKSPDFTDIADPGRFQKIDFKAPPKPSNLERALNALTRFTDYLLASPKRILVTAFILFVLAAGIFGDRDDRTRTQIDFADKCSSAGGDVVGDDQDLCIIGNNVYRYWNLPGEKDERRSMAFVIGSTMIPCMRDKAEMCLSVNGEPFGHDIEGFTFVEGQTQILFVERVQICDPGTDDNCTSSAEMFQFRTRLNRNN